MVRQHRVERRPALLSDAGEQQVLLGCEVDAGAEYLHDAPDGGPELRILRILDTSVFDEQPVERAAAPLIVPPQVIVHVADPDGSGRPQWPAEPLLHLRPEPIEPAVVQEILEPGVTTVAAVAVIALHGDHGLGHLDHVLRGSEPQGVGEAGVGDLLAVGHPQAAAHQHVEPRERVPVGNHHEPQIVAVDIGAVVVRGCDGGLELAREIALSVDRLGLGRRCALGDLVAVEPDLVIGPGPRQQARRDLARHGERLIAQPTGQRRRAAHHVALHVAAGAERRDQRVVQGADGSFQVALHHAVKLVVLSRRDPQRAVAVAPRQLVEHEILIGGEHAARNLAADHEGVVRLEAGIAPLAACVAVVLLIDAVELEQLRGRVFEMAGVGGELRGERAAQPAARLLDLFDGAHVRVLVGHPHSSLDRSPKPTKPKKRRARSQSGSGPTSHCTSSRNLAHVRPVPDHRASQLRPPPLGSAHIPRQHGRQRVAIRVLVILERTLPSSAGRCQPAMVRQTSRTVRTCTA